MEVPTASRQSVRTVDTGTVFTATARPSQVRRGSRELNNDPCWFLEDVSLRTGTQIVALIGIFTHPAFMFIAVDYWLFGVTELVRHGALAMFCANAILTPVNYVLLIGAKMENRWLCSVWIVGTLIFALCDIAIVIVFYNWMYFVIFQIAVVLLTLYKLWVVGTFCRNLFKKEIAEKNVKKAGSGQIAEQSITTLDDSRIVVLESEMQI